MKLSEQTGMGLVLVILLSGGILCFFVAIVKRGTWAIAGSILIFTWVYLNVNISKEHQRGQGQSNEAVHNNKP